MKFTETQLAGLGVATKAGDALKVKFCSKSIGTATVSGTLGGVSVTRSPKILVTAIGDGFATGIVVVPYGKKTLVVPLTWTAGAKPTMAAEE